MYGAGLAHCGIHASRSRCESTLSLRRLVGTELQAHFSRLPANWGVNIMTAQPTDVVVFVAQVWVPQHGRTVLSDGQTYPAASNIRGMFPALEYLFDRNGRGGVWKIHSPFNNPCRSTFVDDYRRGLEKYIIENGPAPVAAHPLEEQKLSVLVIRLDADYAARRANPQQINTPYRKLQCLILARDALMFVYLFFSLQRGVEGGRIGMANLSFPGDNSAVIPGDPRLLTAPMIRIRTGKLKTDPNGGVLDIPRAADAKLCFMSRLHSYAHACADSGSPLQAPHYALFRPIDTHDRGVFANTTLTSAACLGRLKRALNDIGANEGETVHSSRRGGMQRERAAGVPAEETMARAIMKTKRIYDMYVDTSRPTRRKKHVASLPALPPLPAAVGPPSGSCEPDGQIPTPKAFGPLAACIMM